MSGIPIIASLILGVISGVTAFMCFFLAFIPPSELPWKSRLGCAVSGTACGYLCVRSLMPLGLINPFPWDVIAGAVYGITIMRLVEKLRVDPNWVVGPRPM